MSDDLDLDDFITIIGQFLESKNNSHFNVEDVSMIRNTDQSLDIGKATITEDHFSGFIPIEIVDTPFLIKSPGWYYFSNLSEVGNSKGIFNTDIIINSDNVKLDCNNILLNRIYMHKGNNILIKNFKTNAEILPYFLINKVENLLISGLTLVHT